MSFMKKLMVLIVSLAALASLTACGSSHCKECDKEVYKDGYCEYHYAINVAQDVVGDAADDLLNSLMGG